MPNKKIKIKVTKKKKKITTKQSGNIIRVNVSNSSPGGVAQRSAPASGGVVYIPQQAPSSDSNMAQILQYLYLERNKDAEQLKSLNPNNVRDAAEARRIAQEASQEAKQLITISNPKMLAPDFSVPAPPPRPPVNTPTARVGNFAPSPQELASRLESLKPVRERFSQITAEEREKFVKEKIPKIEKKIEPPSDAVRRAIALARENRLLKELKEKEKKDRERAETIAGKTMGVAMGLPIIAETGTAPAESESYPPSIAETEKSGSEATEPGPIDERALSSSSSSGSSIGSGTFEGEGGLLIKIQPKKRSGPDKDIASQRPLVKEARTRSEAAQYDPETLPSLYE